VKNLEENKMGMFKKKEKKVEEKEEIVSEPMVKTPIIDAEINDVEKGINPEVDNSLKENLDYYNANYGELIAPQDFAKVDPADAMMCNLLFGILFELKQLKEELRGKK